MIERDIIGIFGKMNAGKSTLMNLLTQQETSIVDSQPGTTADTKVALLEIHDIGPVKLFDTAGYDEEGRLGDKKKEKVISAMKECDLVLVVLDPREPDVLLEKEIIRQAKELDKQVLIIQNTFGTQESVPFLPGEHTISLDAKHDRQRLLDFILQNYIPKTISTQLIPFLKKDAFYILNIPMDSETPPGRLLRPQQMVEEYITRNWAYPVLFRMDLGRIRSGDQSEMQRFRDLLEMIRPHAVITDSQAMDIMPGLVPEDIGLTTFSIIMINHQSRGQLQRFVDGARQLDSIRPGEKVLIAEACNHSRIGEDIGTVQIPRIMEKKHPGVIIEHAFGREFPLPAKLREYKLIVHCGGCMISSQKMAARLRDLGEAGVPITNYGVILSHLNGGLERTAGLFS